MEDLFNDINFIPELPVFNEKSPFLCFRVFQAKFDENSFHSNFSLNTESSGIKFISLKRSSIFASHRIPPICFGLTFAFFFIWVTVEMMSKCRMLFHYRIVFDVDYLVKRLKIKYGSKRESWS